MNLKTNDGKLEPHQALGLHLGFVLVIVAVGLFLFALIARQIVYNGNIVTLDKEVANALHTSATLEWVDRFKLITLMGFQGLWVVVALVALYLWRNYRRSVVVAWVIGWFGAEVLNFILKNFFARARPTFTDPLLTAANYSFPSGHAMGSLVVYGLLAYLIMVHLQKNWQRVIVFILAALFIGLIGYTRIYLGVHYLSDIVAGYIFGLIWLNIVIYLLERYTRGRLTKQKKQ